MEGKINLEREAGSCWLLAEGKMPQTQSDQRFDGYCKMLYDMEQYSNNQGAICKVRAAVYEVK